MTAPVRKLIEDFWHAMNTNDFGSAARYFHEDFVLEWPQTNERVRGAENWVNINEAYPAAGKWRFRVDRIVADGENAASDVMVTDGERIDRAISFFQLREGQIWRVVEYWPDPSPALQWRKEWVEPI